MINEMLTFKKRDKWRSILKSNYSENKFARDVSPKAQWLERPTGILEGHEFDSRLVNSTWERFFIYFIQTTSLAIFENYFTWYSPKGSLIRKKIFEIFLLDNLYWIAKRTKSKNRMQITEFPAGFSQRKRVLREIQGM